MKNNTEYALNGICPYFTMFPLDFPLNVLRNKSQEGDIVLDPFCGRGTTNYASRVSGLYSIGIDSSPVAAAIAEAKLANTTPERIVRVAENILNELSTPEVPEGDFWKWAYHPEVLLDLCKIRDALNKSCSSDTRIALRGIILGALHGPRRKQGSSYFSNQSPRTYAPKPAYAIKYWKNNNLKPEKINLVDVIKERAERYYRGQVSAAGKILNADSRSRTTFYSIDKNVSWIITSPPYYGMRTYIPDQWIRAWFLGGSASVDYSTKEQLKHSSKDDFIQDLHNVWNNLENVCKKNAIMVIRFGAISERKVSPGELIKLSLQNTNWRCQTITSAGFSTTGRRQATHMTQSAGEAIEEVDIWARLN